ncbi:glycosyltransferase family 9 protein [Biostraticola tofi]|uniref:ADP-heptose:LPS heptosyltransferase n=1 Tax=Biostraticola tofi TaxID=466109 RepID=A0A4R3YPJ2_9GAMM|nr:glycosyltransferase family 9 protein [Biostraticola tofi]TCV93498.1 ADP-heptose:LPS heptosyltransferase [Biostraticola tofi]
MSYVILFIFLLPLKGLMKCFHKPTGRNLVIQTAKIGDFINITPLLRHLKTSDVLISASLKALATRDDTIDDIFYIEQHKSGLLKKIRLAFKLLNRYSNVYLLHPNSTNLFFAAICNAENKQFLSVYTRKWYQGIFYLTASGRIDHRRDTLSLEDYLKLADRRLTRDSEPKHATSPLWKAERVDALIPASDKLKIGISISAGNKAKTVPAAIWAHIISRLDSLPCVFYVFGPKNEQPYLDALLQHMADNHRITSLIGKLALEEVPYAISRMDCYMASDSGNIYIANAQQVPVVCFAGPCCMEEQRPLGEALIIRPQSIAPSSFVFSAPYRFEHTPEELFSLSTDDFENISDFVTKLSNRAVSNG